MGMSLLWWAEPKTNLSAADRFVFKPGAQPKTSRAGHSGVKCVLSSERPGHSLSRQHRPQTTQGVFPHQIVPTDVREAVRSGPAEAEAAARGAADKR